ncbi:hypothetical protein D3C78_1605720 [compost metagenome]
MKVSPSSPPVHSDSCEARVWKADATASVIMAKKIARTRSENSPTASDSSRLSNSAQPMPSASADQLAPSRPAAIATP